jgi:hypothetical protein
MQNSDYIPRKEEAFATWLAAFITTLTGMYARIAFPGIATTPATRTSAPVADQAPAVIVDTSIIGRLIIYFFTQGSRRKKGPWSDIMSAIIP